MNYLVLNSNEISQKNCHAVMITVCGMSEIPTIILFCVGEQKTEREINNICLDAYPDYARAILQHKHVHPCIGHIWLT